MNSDAFHNVIQCLAGDHQPQVWSLLVSVFGDLVPQGDALSGAVLSDVLSPAGVRPEAMRVALHRLRNDHWIETDKRGREAFHVLSDDGIAQCAVASQRIYAASQAAGQQWHVLCYPSTLASPEQDRAEKLEETGYVSIGAGVYLANHAPQENITNALVLQGTLTNVPDWLRASIVTSELDAAFAQLSTALDQIDLRQSTAEDLRPAQIAALRTLIVHRWRKLVLKMPVVPDMLLGPDNSALKCRARVMKALRHLPKPSVSDLSSRALRR